MADDTEQDEGTETSAPSNAELDAKVGALDAKIDMILSKLGGAKEQAHEHAERHTEERLDRPSSIAEEIRQQLDEQRAREAADAEKRGNADRLAAVEERLTGMTERVPEAPLRRVEKIMGWR